MLRLSVPLLVSACVLCGHAQAGVIFTDTFDSGASPAWGNERGNWAASGGVYSAQSPSNNPLTYSSLPFDLTNFTLDVDIDRVRDGGIWLRSNAQGQGVLLVTGGGIGSELYWHVVNGTDGVGLTPLNKVSGLFTPGVSDAHLHIVVEGDTYSVYLNGGATPVTTLTTDLFSDGRVGLYSNSGQAFDNVVLAVPDAASPVPEPSTLVTSAALLAVVLRLRRRHPADAGLVAASAGPVVATRP